MDLMLKIIVNWLLLDILIWATIWYATTTIRPLCPNWWQKNICDEVPFNFD
jgi:hypothetical protein